MTINGLAGTVVPFSATVDGAGIVGWNYLFISGRYLYVLLVTSGDDTWGGNRTALKRMAESFTVTPAPSPATPAATTLPTPSPATPTPGFTPQPTATAPAPAAAPTAPASTPVPAAQP